MNEEELEVLLGKKVLGVAQEEFGDWHYIFLQTTYGKNITFSSHSPIYVETEQEQ